MLNLRNKKVREDMKKRLKSEVGRVPTHRQWEVESYLYLIACYEREEGEDRGDEKNS